MSVLVLSGPCKWGQGEPPDGFVDHRCSVNQQQIFRQIRPTAHGRLQLDERSRGDRRKRPGIEMTRASLCSAQVVGSGALIAGLRFVRLTTPTKTNATRAQLIWRKTKLPLSCSSASQPGSMTIVVVSSSITAGPSTRSCAPINAPS